MRAKNTPAGRQIALPRPVAALAHQLARAEERAVQVVIERALKAYAERSPEWQAERRKRDAEAGAYILLPPKRDGDAQQQDGSDRHPKHDIAHQEA